MTLRDYIDIRRSPLRAKKKNVGAKFAPSAAHVQSKPPRDTRIRITPNGVMCARL